MYLSKLAVSAARNETHMEWLPAAHEKLAVSGCLLIRVGTKIAELLEHHHRDLLQLSPRERLAGARSRAGVETEVVARGGSTQIDLAWTGVFAWIPICREIQRDRQVALLHANPG